jgi:hypothetical protein
LVASRRASPRVAIEEMTERVWKQHWFWKRYMDDDNHHIVNGKITANNGASV